MDILFSFLIPAVVGGVVFGFMEVLKKVSTWVDARPAWLKRIIVALFAAAAVKGSELLGVQLPEDLLHMDGEMATAILTALFAYLAHFVKKQSA